MKTTLELPDSILIEAKKLAAEERTTLRALVEQGLRHVLSGVRGGRAARPKIRWVTVAGGAPVETASREAMAEWMARHR
jgi:negative regulator of sigma E activity